MSSENPEEGLSKPNSGDILQSVEATDPIAPQADPPITEQDPKRPIVYLEQLRTASPESEYFKNLVNTVQINATDKVNAYLLDTEKRVNSFLAEWDEKLALLQKEHEEITAKIAQDVTTQMITIGNNANQTIKGQIEKEVTKVLAFYQFLISLIVTVFFVVLFTIASSYNISSIHDYVDKKFDELQLSILHGDFDTRGELQGKTTAKSEEKDSLKQSPQSKNKPPKGDSNVHQNIVAKHIQSKKPK